MEKTCPNCDKVFETINPKAKYCSDTCRKVSHKKKLESKPTTVTFIEGKVTVVDKVILPVIEPDIPMHSMEDAGNRIWQKLLSEFKDIVSTSPTLQASHDAFEIFLARVERYGYILTACQISALTERVANYRNGTYRVMNLQKLTKA